MKSAPGPVKDGDDAFRPGRRRPRIFAIDEGVGEIPVEPRADLLKAAEKQTLYSSDESLSEVVAMQFLTLH
jgi:hypothetical protein